MTRLALSLLALYTLGGPALAADWQDDWAPLEDFRGPLSNEPKDWAGLGTEDDAVGFEFGARYWYSWGAQSFTGADGDAGSADNAHAGELHLRIDDYSSRSYAKALVGYSVAVTGSKDDFSDGGAVADGQLGYAGADIGWHAFGDGQGSGLGVFAGYQYWNDSPRASFVASPPGASDFDPVTGEILFTAERTRSNLAVNALRLGVSGRANFAEIFDISAEAAVIPYAHVGGVLGGNHVSADLTPLGNPRFVRTSETVVDGWGYGAMGEVMVGVTPVENLTFRLGARAWYLQGSYDASYSAAEVTDPTNSDLDPEFDVQGGFEDQVYSGAANPFSMLRYGLVAEVSYTF